MLKHSVRAAAWLLMLAMFEDVEVVGSLIEAEQKDFDGDETCEDNEDEDVEQWFSKGSLMVFSLFV